MFEFIVGTLTKFLPGIDLAAFPNRQVAAVPAGKQPESLSD